MNGAFYQISDLKTSVAGILTGVNVNNIIDFKGKCQRAAVNMLMKGDIPEMSDRYAMYLYDQVFDYAPPPTIFGSLIQDVRPQGVSRSPYTDYPYKKPLLDFDIMKQTLRNGTMITFEQRSMQQIMRIAQAKTQPAATIDPMSQIGGWIAGGNASGLTQDLTVYYDDPASLRFNLAANGTQGYIEQTYTSPTDLTQYEGVGVGFLAVSLPSASAITSIGMHLGNDNAHYWDVSATQGFLGAWVANDFLLVALDLSKSTATGSVDPTKIDYVRVYFNYTSTSQLSNVRVGGLWLSLPSPTEILFETPAIFVPSGSTTPQKTITADSDSLTLADAAYGIYCYEVSREIALGKGATIASGLIAGLDLVLEGNGGGKIGLYQKFRGDNPAQTLRTVGNYYDAW